MKIKIYGQTGCKWCDRAEVLLQGGNLPYTYTLLNPTIYEELSVITQGQAKTVPIVFIDSVYIGGYKELEEKIFGTK